MTSGASTNQRDWLVLLNAPSIGGASLISLIENLGTASALAGSSTRELKQLGLPEPTVTAINQPDHTKIESDLEWLSQPGRHLVCWDDENYPALLRRIDGPPAALFVDGDPDCLWQPQIAIIGSRNPTAGGLEHARDFAATLARQGMTITSGLASGIDCAAHVAALEAGACTVAVNGTGLDRVYPQSSQQIAAGIRSHGAMVSELPLGSPPRRQHFPSRNRIISGLSLGVLVIEAGLNSGTQITARKAAEQGREVFALPGSLHNPLAKGCHRLIREGARLVETTEDIMQELGPVAAELGSAIKKRLALQELPDTPMRPERHQQAFVDPEYEILWNALGYDPRPVDKLVECSGLSAREVSSMLLLMELKGLVRKQGISGYSRTGKATAGRATAGRAT